MSSCFTGVEGTSKINLSRKDIVAVGPSKEDIFLENISRSVLQDWDKGKSFIVADDKFRLISEGIGNSSINVGDTIFFDHAASRISADGSEGTIIFFDSAYGKLGTIIEKSLREARSSATVADIPMLIDIEIVEKVKNKLKGVKLWTRTALWYTDSMTYKKGRKFIPVTVVDVDPGNSFFPLNVKFRDNNGEYGNLLMNIGSSGNESRNFGKLFTLSDPKYNYKQISSENWMAIQSEQLRLGMTKEECRLSKGNPSDVDMGHNYSNAVEIWYYPDGSFLQFVDGLLTRF